MFALREPLGIPSEAHGRQNIPAFSHNSRWNLDKITGLPESESNLLTSENQKLNEIQGLAEVAKKDIYILKKTYHVKFKDNFVQLKPRCLQIPNGQSFWYLFALSF